MTQEKQSKKDNLPSYLAEDAEYIKKENALASSHFQNKIKVENGKFVASSLDEIKKLGSSFDAIILRTPSNLSKVYYANRYSIGVFSAPVCFSNDGIRPDSSVVSPCSESCRNCEKGQWRLEGSLNVTDCKSRRLLSLYLLSGEDSSRDKRDSVYVLSLSPTSLKHFNGLIKDLAMFDAPYFGVVVTFSCELEKTYFTVRCNRKRFLTAKEYASIKVIRESDFVRDMFSFDTSDPVEKCTGTVEHKDNLKNHSGHNAFASKEDAVACSAASGNKGIEDNFVLENEDGTPFTSEKTKKNITPKTKEKSKEEEENSWIFGDDEDIQE